MRLGPISLTWRKKRASSDTWLLDETPTAEEEFQHFGMPELLLDTKNTRDYLENLDYSRDIRQKKHFARFSYCVAVPWFLLLVCSVVAQGYDGGWQLEVPEFVALVTTTTGSIFGFAYVLGRFLYGSKGYRSETSSKDSVQSENNT